VLNQTEMGWKLEVKSRFSMRLLLLAGRVHRIEDGGRSHYFVKLLRALAWRDSSRLFTYSLPSLSAATEVATDA
jgi:hypothetical protein